MNKLTIAAFVAALLSGCATSNSGALHVARWHYLTEEQMPAVIGECEHIKTDGILQSKKDKETGETKKVLHWYTTMRRLSYTKANTIGQVCGEDGNAIRGEFYLCEGITFTEADFANKLSKMCPK